MNPKNPIELASYLLNAPIDPNLAIPFEIREIVNFHEAEAGETVEYFASSAQDREITNIYSADANGGITYHKVPLKTTLPLSFVGMQTLMETVLIDEILNSKDSRALAAKKDAILNQLNSKEVQNCFNLILAASTQEVTKGSGEDLLDVIINLKQKVSNFADDYVLIVASDVMDEIEKYDKDNANNYNYKLSIFEEIEKLGIKKVIKVYGAVNYDSVSTPILANGVALLVGRSSRIALGRPLHLVRRKFSGDIASMVGVENGISRLIDVVKTPLVVNSDGKNTLGFACYGYESVIQVLTNYRAVSFSQDIIS